MLNNLSLIQSNAKNIPLRDKSVQCIVTSPPYFGLRDYGNDDQIGLETTLRKYIDNLIVVFDECWRVLKDDGTLWLNLGDSYAGSGGPGNQWDNKGTKDGFIKYDNPNRKPAGFKPKDLMGVPWRVVFSLQDRGWYLRSDIIWHKPNVMPESVRDRPTKTHEYIFLLTKNKKYYYDIEAIKEDSIDKESYVGRSPRNVHTMASFDKKNYKFAGSINEDGTLGDVGKTYPKRNKRTVWKISTKSYSGAHFATFPPELPEICIKAGSSEKGECPKCGKVWKRVMGHGETPERTTRDHMVDSYPGRETVTRMNSKEMKTIPKTFLGWESTCEHILEPVPQIVLDPFGGSGTTAMVARNLGRHGISFDISWDYLQLAKERVGNKQLEEWKSGKRVEENWQDLPMFTEKL